MAAAGTNVTLDDIIEVCQTSSSQEEILRHCPFVDPDNGAPLTSGGVPVASTGIAIASLPETGQDTTKDRGSQDVFHTPPEQQSSQSASEGHGRAIRKMVETDDEAQGFFDFSENAEAAEYVDLRDESELGFPQGVLNRGTGSTLVAECLDGNDGGRIIEISRSEIEKFRISKRELLSKDSSGEPPRKTMKNSEQNPGFESSQACFGIEPQKIKQHLDNSERNLVSDPKDLCNFGAVSHPRQNVQIGKEICLGVGDKTNHFDGTSAEKNSGFCENLGRPVTQSKIAKSATQCVENIESEEGDCEEEKGTDEGNKAVNEIVEQKGGDEQPESSVIPSSAGDFLKNIAKIKKEIENGNNFVFDVFKALRKEDSAKDSLEDVSLLHLATSRGFNFPRPYWWKENDNERN